jgi:uncharacterized protein (TIGR02246 family)
MPRSAKPFLIFLSLAVAACATARGNTQREEQAIRDLNRRWVATIPAQDASSFASFYADDGVLFVPNAPPMRGPDAIRRGVAEMFKMPNLQLSFAPTRIDVAASGDLATELGTYRMSFDSPQGRVEDEGNYVSSWRKRDGQWKVISDINTSSKPMMMPTQAAAAPAPVETPVSYEGERAEMAMGDAMTWTDFAPAGFPPGAKRTIIHGDPTKSGDYTMRLRFPNGYRIPPHFHQTAEHITVLQGSFRFGMGERFDASTLASHGPGSFIYAPAKMPHYAMTSGETVVQLHGTGPFVLNLVDQP